MADVSCAPRSSFESGFHGRSFAIDQAASLALNVPDGGMRPDEIEAPHSPWILVEVDSILLGMPQLSLFGLSETWLLRELGHRHWMMLARLAGQSAPNFVDERGAPVYAAFCALSVQKGDFGAARENAHLVVSSRLRRVSRTQMLSNHRVSVGGRCVAEVELVSTFVRRAVDGGNHCVARFEVPGLPPIAPKFESDSLAGNAAAIRSGRAGSHMGFAIDQRQPEAAVSFDPCPSQDFNGAGFLYFSNFIAFIDRAEWVFARKPSADATTTLRRDVFFSGNLDPGETIEVRLMESREEDEAFAHHCQMVREQDGAVLARVFTFRSMS